MLFELIARRYETRSLAIAANQPFGAWSRVFPDQAVTVAAILEMNGDSFRRRAAATRHHAKAVVTPSTSSGTLNPTANDTEENAD